MEAIKQQVVSLILDNFDIDHGIVESAALIEDGLLDSFDMVLLVEAIETNFNIVILLFKILGNSC